MILLDMDIPKNCVKCDEIGIRAILECRLIFNGCANCGRHPNCPIKAEIPKDATNGDVIKAMFPNITLRFRNTDEYTNKPRTVEISVESGAHILTTISTDMWNAPWKGNDESRTD